MFVDGRGILSFSDGLLTILRGENPFFSEFLTARVARSWRKERFCATQHCIDQFII